MSALIDLYTTTGGASWLDNTHWMEGEPCVARWRGVTCCPDTHPRLEGGACFAGGNRIVLNQPEDVFPAGCDSGSVTGTSADVARCVVTAIDLVSNNLVGWLNESVGALTSLQRFVVSGNELSGELPIALSALPVIGHVQVLSA